MPRGVDTPLSPHTPPTHPLLPSPCLSTASTSGSAAALRRPRAGCRRPAQAGDCRRVPAQSVLMGRPLYACDPALIFPDLVVSRLCASTHSTQNTWESWEPAQAFSIQNTWEPRIHRHTKYMGIFANPHTVVCRH